MRTLRASTGAARAELLVELLATFAYELALAGSPAARLSMDRLPRRIVALRGRRALDVPPSVARVTFAPGRVLGLEAAEAREPYHVIDEPILLALEDSNPLAMFEAHPDKAGNGVSLGGHSVEAWLASLRASLGLIRAWVPGIADEMATCIELVVPVGFDAGMHLSASYREVIGALYVSPHPDPLTMAEALIHELSHTKLNLLFELDPVLENAFDPLYPSPVRPDPRPLHGVLLAVHAFLAVLRLYERMRAADHPLSRTEAFAARARAIRRGNEEGLAVLAEHARPTPVGARCSRRWPRGVRGFARPLSRVHSSDPP